MNAQIERAVEHFRALLEEQVARASRLEAAAGARETRGDKP